MYPEKLNKYITRLLVLVLLGLGVIRLAAQIEPPAAPAQEPIPPEAMQAEPNATESDVPETAVGPGGELYVRGGLQQTAVRGPDGIIAVITDSAAYVWNNLSNTWYSINLSGDAVELMLSQDTVGVLTTDRAYAWNLGANEWVWTFISGRPLDITGSNGHLGVITDREAYAFNRDTGGWTKTYLSGQVIDITGIDDYYNYTRYPAAEQKE